MTTIEYLLHFRKGAKHIICVSVQFPKQQRDILTRINNTFRIENLRPKEACDLPKVAQAVSDRWRI